MSTHEVLGIPVILLDPVRSAIVVQIIDERDRQDSKWGGVPGVDRRDDHTYPAVLTEEVGESCRAWLERDVSALREELVQVAAVAVAWIEELDRGGAVPRPTVGHSEGSSSETGSRP